MPRAKKLPEDDTPEMDEPMEGQEVASRSTIKEEARAIHSWLASYGEQGDIRVSLYRKEPKRYRGTKTDGLLETFSEPISHEEIQQQHGGGKYQIQVYQSVPGKSGVGQWRYAGARTFDIAGSPRLDGLRHEEDEDDDDGAPLLQMPASDPLSQQAMSLAASLTRESRQEAAELRRMMGSQQSDPAMLAMIDGLQRNLAELQKVAAHKDERLMQIMS